MRNAEKYRIFTINTDKYRQKLKFRKIQKYWRQSQVGLKNCLKIQNTIKLSNTMFPLISL